MKRLSTAIAFSTSVGLVTALAQGCGTSSSDRLFDETSSTSRDAGVQDTGTGGKPGALSPVDASPPPVLGSVDSGKPTALDGGCATATATATRVPVYMYMILDGSGSMLSDSKWDAVVPALDELFDQFLADADKTLGVGLVVFSDANDPTSDFFSGGGPGPYPSSADVFVGFVDKAQHAALRARIDNTSPSGITPTHKALQGVYPKLENFVALAPLPKDGKKVVVLISDGVPNGDDGDPKDEQTACVNLAAEELAKAGPAGPIMTFSIGVGPFPTSDTGGYDAAFMGRMAVAGGTAPKGCDPNTTDPKKVCHFQVTPSQSTSAADLKKQFVAALNTIRGQVMSCEFKLDPSTSGKVDPNKVNVQFEDGNGKSEYINKDPKNGWTYDNDKTPTKVVLNGTSCDKIKSTPKGKVSIVLGCETIVH